MKLLLLSNSTNFGEPYLKWPIELIKQTLADHQGSLIFIPYAGVTITWDDYTAAVNNSLSEIGVSVKGIHQQNNAIAAVEQASAILVGGGNTFQLLKNLQENGLVDAIHNKVKNGTPYIGWSAGSNVAGPTIKTTNDMPIAEPSNFDALNLVPFQLNPHYTEAKLPNHGGETRPQRLSEFLAANPEDKVVCLPEATAVTVDGSEYIYHGPESKMVLMTSNAAPLKLSHGAKLSKLL